MENNIKYVENLPNDDIINILSRLSPTQLYCVFNLSDSLKRRFSKQFDNYIENDYQNFLTYDNRLYTYVTQLWQLLASIDDRETCVLSPKMSKMIRSNNSYFINNRAIYTLELLIWWWQIYISKNKLKYNVPNNITGLIRLNEPMKNLFASNLKALSIDSDDVIPYYQFIRLLDNSITCDIPLLLSEKSEKQLIKSLHNEEIYLKNLKRQMILKNEFAFNF